LYKPKLETTGGDTYGDSDIEQFPIYYTGKRGKCGDENESTNDRLLAC